MINRFILFILLTISVVSCIDDSFTTSPSDQPRFSVDTLKMGVVFTDEMTTTHRFTVINPASKSLTISNIALSGDNSQYFRLNVDGFSGKDFHNIEIRGKDSIYVFVEATLPATDADMPVEVETHIDFLTNGVTRSVVVNASGQDLIRLKDQTISEDTEFKPGKPYRIVDSLVVAPEATLRVAAGTRLLFHDKASLIVYGTLICEGTVDEPVTLSGDRTGNVVTDISFDLMSRQWEGVEFRPGSQGNSLTNTIIKNTVNGVYIDGENEAATLTMVNCRLRNSGSTVLTAVHSQVDAVGCEFAESAAGLVYLHGGSHTFNHCTFANYYLFSVISGPAIAFGHADDKTADETSLPLLHADISNSIIYGLGSDLSHNDLTGMDIMIRNCLIKSNGTDDDNFINCIWGEDPLYYTVRNDYIFDYRLRDESPAIAAANPSLTRPEANTDGYGLSRGSQPDLGAYVYTPSEDEGSSASFRPL